ncbi:MAG TPA: c-type cytochrome biogenesis protein CcmI [Rhodopila sp.]|nr:c-type cytochrome biogenesis protein CcmI [Rhodopila sp.]
MILPFLLALLAFLALLPILTPLLRGGRPVAARATYDQAVYRDQLHELDRDIARGVITADEAGSARLEIQRRLLAADRQPAPPARLTRSPVLAGLVFVFVIGGSLASYLWLGAPGIPDEPYSARQAERVKDNSPIPLERATATLAAKLKQNPSDADGWVLYGHSLAMLRQWDQAEAAYSRAIALGKTDPDVLGDHAEVLVMQAGGTVTPAAEAAFRQILKTDPNSGIARYYLAVADMQAGEPRKAIAGYQSVLAALPENSPLRPQLGQKIADAAQAAGIPAPALAKGTPVASPAAPGPDAKTMEDAANMPAAQRQAMINGMVASLAAKQAADPTNLDGWLRLGRAYAVLHQTDKAADAYDKAAALKPGDASIRLQEVRALLQDQAPTDSLPPRVIDLLNQVQATDPNQPVVLWYLGIAAAQARHVDDARRYWTKLLTLVPPGGDDARMLHSALDALPQPKSGG